MSDLLLFLVEVTVVFALALLGARMASGARAAVRHLILASAFGIVLVLPLATLLSPPLAVIPTLPAYPDETVADTPAVAAPTVAVPRTAGTSPTAAPPAAPAPERSVTSETWVLFFWTLVAIVALIPLGVSLWHLRNIRRRGQPWPEGMMRMRDLARAAGLQPPVVLLHDGIAGPITTGVLRPVIALPASAVTWGESHVVNALVHELEHVRRRDWLVHLTSRAVCALYWFHPLAWIAWRRLRLEAERACDDAVLAREDAAAYAEQLLNLARQLTHKPALSGLSMASSSDLSTRIRSILDTMRPRGRAGKVMIACTALVAVGALAALAPLRMSEDPEQLMQRTAALLAKRSDADSLAAAAVMSVKHPDQALQLIARASQMAPERADLVWLNVQLCGAVASCDPEPLEKRLRALDDKNGAAWFAELERADKHGDEASKAEALASIARSQRVDIYWTTLVARLSPQVASTRTMSVHYATAGVIGVLAAQAIPSYRILSDSCKSEYLSRADVNEVCRGIANSLLNGDTRMTEMIGVSIAKRAWAENSPIRAKAAAAERNWDHALEFAEPAIDWFEKNAGKALSLFEQHHREQEVWKHVLISIGENPDPVARELVGKVVPPYPDGEVEKGGLCVSIVTFCDHSIGVIEKPRSAQPQLLALRSMGRKPDGKPVWQVMDQLPAPQLKPGQMLTWCIQTVSTYAIVDGASRSEWVAPTWAARLDASGEKFQILNPDDVKCASPIRDAD